MKSNTLQPGTKILFANFPADGHFNPLTGLAVHLKNIGCDVRWYTSRKYQEKIERLDIPFYGLDKAVDFASDPDIEKVFPERRKYKSQVAKLKFDMIHVFIMRAPEYYEDIKAIHKEFPFQLLIADVAFGGIPFVKDKMKIPVISVSVFPLPETSKDLPPSGLGMTPSYNAFGKLRQRILRKIADAFLFARPTKVMRELLLSYGIEPGDHNIFDILIQKSTIVLQSGTPSFEYTRSDMSRHIHFAGPLLPYSKKEETPRWYSNKLRKYDKVILVTQGTVERNIEKLLVPTLEAFKDSDCLVIATTGGAQTKELQLQYPQENIIIEDFIPFDDVMPYADVYITNGGYGGVLLSIQNQLPLVVGGIHEGKNEINARVGYFKLGVNLKTEKPSVLQLRKAVEEVLSNPVYSNNIKKLSEEFKAYHPNQICEVLAARLLPEAVIQKEPELIY